MCSVGTKTVNFLFTLAREFYIGLDLILHPGGGCRRLALQVISIPGRALQQCCVGVEQAGHSPMDPISVLGRSSSWCLPAAVVSNSRRYQKEDFSSNKIKWLDSEQRCCTVLCTPEPISSTVLGFLATCF